MRYGLFLFAAVIVSAVSTGSANAQCDMVCPVGNDLLCQLNPGSQSVQDCTRLWSCIHAKYPGQAGQFVNGRPPAKCAHLFKPHR